MMELLLYRLSHGLDAKNTEDLDNVIGRCSDGIDRRLTEYFHQVDTVCLKDPLLECLVLAVVIDDDPLFEVLRRIVHVDLCDLFDTLEGHVREKV